MDDILKRWLSILVVIIIVVGFSSRFVSVKDESIDLPATLANVKCLPAPDNDKHAKTNRALLEYDYYAIYSLCIPKTMMSRKDKLKCAYSEENPDLLVCDESAVLEQNYVHAGISDIYAADSPNTRTPNPKSKVTILFSQRSLPLNEPKFQHYTEETYVKQGIVTPTTITLLSNPVCQSPLSGKPQGQSEVIRESSSCFVNARFDILKINLDIEIFANDYDKLTRDEQIKEINFWLNFVSQLVVVK